MVCYEINIMDLPIQQHANPSRYADFPCIFSLWFVVCLLLPLPLPLLRLWLLGLLCFHFGLFSMSAAAAAAASFLISNSVLSIHRCGIPSLFRCCIIHRSNAPCPKRIGLDASKANAPYRGWSSCAVVAQLPQKHHIGGGVAASIQTHPAHQPQRHL